MKNKLTDGTALLLLAVTLISAAFVLLAFDNVRAWRTVAAVAANAEAQIKACAP